MIHRMLQRVFFSSKHAGSLGRRVREILSKPGHDRTPKPLGILITNIQLTVGSGTEQFVRDLALGMRSRGHKVAVFTPHLGEFGRKLIKAGIPVHVHLDEIPFVPDIIHGHHHVETVRALEKFPQARGLFVGHDGYAWHDLPPSHPRLFAYVAVDANCRERMEQILPAGSVRIIGNWVDTDRFARRALLPKRPHRALIFSNYAEPGGPHEIIVEACRMEGIECDVIGDGVGKKMNRPEDALKDYDLVFAKGKCAFESLGTGAAVILYHTNGLGPLVTDYNMAACRLWNFGIRLMTEPVSPEGVRERIHRYDADDAGIVTGRIREESNLARQLDEYEELYSETLARPKPVKTGYDAENLVRILRFLRETQDRQTPTPGKGKPCGPLTIAQMQKLRVHIAKTPGETLPGAPFGVGVELSNGSDAAISSENPLPIHIIARWRAANGEWSKTIPVRARMAGTLNPGGTTGVVLTLTAPEQPGRHDLRVTLVQEGLQWMDELPEPVGDECILCVVRSGG